MLTPAPAPAPTPFDRRRPFSRADARAAGITLGELLGPGFRKILYDAYVVASVPITIHLRAEAAIGASPPSTYVSHFTAAELWGGVVPTVPEVHVSGPDQTHRCRRRGVKAHISDGRPPPTRHRGLPIATPTQTFLDLAGAGLTLVDLVVLGDSLVKADRVTPEQLVEAAKHWTGRGARLARRASSFVRKGVDSPMESRLRMLIVLAGLPEPQVNKILLRADGSWWMRFDLYYAAFKVLVEYDGRQHAEDTTQWQHDLARRETLDAMGFRLLVITKADFYGSPEQVLVRIRDVLVERGAQGIRRSFRPEWRAHFRPRS
jgi:hypothetical protein